MRPDVERILRACVAQREREIDKVPGQTETLCREILRLRGEAVAPPWLADAAEALGRVRPSDGAPLAPPWLADAAEALGRVRPSDGAPLALNWNQVLQEIRDLRDERDGWKANCESWHMVYNAWQDWSTDLLDELGRQPLHGSHGDGPAREVIAQLAGMAPGVPRCLNCGCFSTVHEVDDEELRNCTGCECRQFLTPDDAATRFVAPEQNRQLGDTTEGQGKSKAPGGKSSEAPGKSGRP